VITFLDHLAHHGHSLTHRCEQHLEFAEGRRIAEFCTSICLESVKRWRPSSGFWDYAGVTHNIASEEASWTRRASIRIRSCSARAIVI
jgi:hypothetical protein